jgi:hypothetical protein
MTWDPNVSVTVVTGAQAVDRAVFTIPLHLTTGPTFPERTRTYASSAEATADTLLGTLGQAAVDAHFAQDLHSPTIMIGRAGDTPAAMVVTLTIAGTPLENETYRTVINGITTEIVAGASPTVTSVHTALSAAITTDLAAEAITVGGVDPDITLTADNAGEPFSYSVAVDPPPGGTATGTLTAVLTTPNAGIGSDLDACLAENDSFYGVTTVINSVTATNLITMEAASAWCQINKRLYLAQSNDANVLTATAGNDLAVLAAKNNSRTAYVWHGTNTELLAVGTMAYKFQADPDEVTTTWAYTPTSGISLKSPRLTSTESGNIESQLGNAFMAFGGNAKFGMGITTTDRNLDTWVTADWLEARLFETYVQLLSDFSARNQKIGLNDKDMQVIVNAGQGILDDGVRIGHLNDGTTSISIPARADMTDADVTARLVRVTASGQATGAAERITVTMTLLLV